MLILAAQSEDEQPPAHIQRTLALFARSAQPIVLAPFSPELTHSLLASVFGEVPNLELVARRVHEITVGNARDIMALAHHLVAEGAVRYEAGAWALPNRLSATDLPASMAEGLTRRLRKLSPEARSLAYAISREPGFGFARAECKLLLGDPSHAVLEAALQRLVEEAVLSVRGGHYQCVQRSWIAPLAEVLSDEEKRVVHQCLAQIFQLRNDGFRHAAWLLRAGEHEHALTVLTEFALSSRAITDKDPAAFSALLRALPEDWLQICDEALALYERLERPARERFALLSRMSGFIGRAGLEVNGVRALRALLQQLEHESGLDCFQRMPADIAPAARIPTALGMANARYLSLPEHARVLDPGAAIKELVSALVAALGSIATTSDFSAFRSLPSLAPITPLAPSILLVHQLAQGLGYRLGGRSEDALSTYEALLERLEQPDRAGLEPSYHFHTKVRVMGAVGTLEATLGRASCLRWVEQVEGAAQYEHVGAVISYLYHLWQGNHREARHFRRRFEMLQLELNSTTDMQYVFSELCAGALTSNMTEVRRAADALEPLASLHVAAHAGLRFARGEYHRIRGDLPAALEELEQALALMKPGEHLVWANAAGAHVRVLSEMGRDEEARALGDAYLAAADAQALGYVKNYIRCPLSRSFAKLGDEARALALAQAAIDVCDALGMTGVNAELAYEAYVRIASAAGDLTRVESQLARCSAVFRRGLAQNANDQAAEQRAREGAGAPFELASWQALTSTFSTCLLECRTLSERAERGLGFVMEHLCSSGGTVYLSTADGLARVASLGDVADDEILRPWALEQLEREHAKQHTVVVTQAMLETLAAGDPDASESHASDFDSYTPVLLAHYDERGFSTTGIMLLRGSLCSPLEDAARLGAELSLRLSQVASASALHGS
jgi:hypothetical protein